MLNQILSNKAFHAKDFFQELDKKELLFLIFLTSHKDEEDVERMYQYTDDIEHFSKFIQQTVGSNIRKLPKEEMIDLLTDLYKDSTLTSLVYKSVYYFSSNDDSHLFNTKLLALERFCSLIFSNKLKKMQEAILSGKLPKKSTPTNEFKKRMLYPQRPILNTLGLVSLLGKLDSAESIIEHTEIFQDFKGKMFCLLLEQFDEIERYSFQKLQSQIKRKEQRLENTEVSLKKKEEQLSKVKETNKDLLSEVKQLKQEIKQLKETPKEVVNHELIAQLTKEIESKEKFIEKIIKDSEKNQETLTTEYQKKIETYEEKVADMKQKEKEYVNENKSLNQKIDIWESKGIEAQLVEYINKNGFMQSLHDFLEPYMAEYEEQLQLAEEQRLLELEKEHKESRMEQRVGYCEIEGNQHYAVFPDGSRIEIKEIPDNLHLGQGQFIKVTIEGSFKWSYAYLFYKGERDYLIQEFGSVIYQNNEPYIMKAVWDKRKLENVASHIHLKENHVVSVNSKGELLRFYRAFRHNADHYLDSIKAKGQEVYYILKVFPNGMMLRNIETGVEEFRLIDTKEVNLKEQQIICVKDNELIHVYYSSKFYTLSNYYKNAETGVVEWQNDVVFARKLSGEVVIVNEIPVKIELKDGDIIKVDEFNNYLLLRKEDTPVSETEERRRLSAPTKASFIKKKSQPQIAMYKDVLIVGKITYENSYRMALYKKGYRAEVADGYEPWAKVKSATKGKDIIVVISDFVSHENMWNMKEEITNIPILYPEHNGANRVVEKIEWFEENGANLIGERG